MEDSKLQSTLHREINTRLLTLLKLQQRPTFIHPGESLDGYIEDFLHNTIEFHELVEFVETTQKEAKIMNHTDPSESTTNWAIHQIQTRLDEIKEFKALEATGPHDTHFDELEEKSEFTFQEIMKIAFAAQLDLDLEDGGHGIDQADRVLEIFHYLTGDPTDIELTARS